MMSRLRARLAFVMPLIFATLLATRTVLGQTGEASSSATEDDRNRRLQFLKARAPGLRPIDSGSAEAPTAQKPPTAEKSVASTSKPSPTPTPASTSRTATASKTGSTSDTPAKSTTAKADPAKKPASAEKSATETSATTAKTTKTGKTEKTDTPEKTTASTAKAAPESSSTKAPTASKASETASKTATAKQPAKKTASTEKPSATTTTKAPAKPASTAKLADTPRISDTPSKPKSTSSENPKPTSSVASATQALNKPATESLGRTSTSSESLENLRLTSTRPRSRYPWKTNIVTTVFWVGERPSGNNFTPNYASSWDMDWSRNYGGYDNPDPDHRRNFIPVAFKPRQNNFYVALPYNDVTRGTTKPEARRVIPWFREAFEREGQSVCRNRWVAIRSRDGKIAYAQWSDCGPFRTDHWQYVFGSERPKPNLNQGAGLDVSPAVRDYLGLRGTDITDWKFVDVHEVPHGPWSLHGDNNTTRRDVRRMTRQSSSEG